jgi:TonB family protein
VNSSIHRYEKWVAAAIILIIIISINVVLFSAVPLLQRFFSSKNEIVLAAQPERQVLIEYKKEEEKKPEPLQSNIRQVANVSIGRSSEPISLKFTPDFAVEGTGEVSMGGENFEAVVFEEGQTDEAAIPVFTPSIPYSKRAEELEIEGTLEAVIVINIDGTVKSVNIIKSPHPSLSTVANSILLTWRFKPARNKGIPVQLRVRQVVDFSLE